jgi:hypothetical protein
MAKYDRPQPFQSPVVFLVYTSISMMDANCDRQYLSYPDSSRLKALQSNMSMLLLTLRPLFVLYPQRQCAN